jgi:hypothetical protein
VAGVERQRVALQDRFSLLPLRTKGCREALIAALGNRPFDFAIQIKTRREGAGGVLTFLFGVWTNPEFRRAPAKPASSIPPWSLRAVHASFGLLWKAFCAVRYARQASLITIHRPDCPRPSHHAHCSPAATGPLYFDLHLIKLRSSRPLHRRLAESRAYLENQIVKYFLRSLEWWHRSLLVAFEFSAKSSPIGN